MSADCFASGFSYGASKTKVSPICIMVVNLICSSVLCVSLFLGKAVSNAISRKVTVAICASILIVMGVCKIAESLLGRKKIAAKSSTCQQDTAVKKISIKESAVLAVALSLDGLAVGVGAGLVDNGVWAYIVIIGFSLITDAVFLACGVFVGSKLAKKTKINLSWLSGAILIGIALMKIFL